MKKTKKRMALAAMSISLLATGAGLGFMHSTIAEAEEKTITINLNGGFQITDVDNSIYSEADVHATIALDTNGQFNLTHENVRAMFNNAPVYLKSTVSGNELYATSFEGTYTYDRYAIDTIVYDANGYYNPATGEGSLPSLLFGLFVDADNDGILDENETLYQSGDTIDMTNVTNLTCYYNPNVYYGTLTVANADQNTHVALQKPYKYMTANNAYADAEKTQLITSITPRDIQPLYHELTEIGGYAFHNSCIHKVVTSITNIELPATVTTLSTNALYGLTNLQSLTGMENIKTVSNLAFYQVAAKNDKAVRYVISPDMIYGGAFRSAENVRLLLTGTSSQDKSTVLNGYFFHQNNGTESNKDIVNHKGYVYVPYGETAEWYAKEENVATTSFAANVAEDGTVTRVNAAMREMYEIQFDLDGGAIGGKTAVASTYMDARAVSVKYNEKEYNLTSYNANGKQCTATNDAAQDLSLLPAENPGIPLRASSVFVGWKDQYDNLWTEEDLKNGGKEVEYDCKVITLTAVYEDAVDLTIKLNGGFQILDTANSVYSDEDIQISVKPDDDGTFTFTHQAVREMLGYAPIYKKATEAPTFGYTYTAINNTIAYDGTGFYNPTKSEGTLPDLLFGLFVDTDNDGVLDENETLYQSGDTIDMTNVSELTCYYNPNVYYGTLQSVNGDQNLQVGLQKAATNYEGSDFLNEQGEIITAFTARDLQPFYHELTEILTQSFTPVNTNLTITSIELPKTVTHLGMAAFFGLRTVSNLQGLENVSFVGMQAFARFGTHLKTPIVVEMNPETISAGAFMEAKNIRLILNDSSMEDKSGVLSGYFFHKANGDESQKDMTKPRGYIYVPYGDTKRWYASETTVGTTSFAAAVDADGAVVRVNVPVREYYDVTFDLNGGTINGTTVLADTRMDAGAVSVVYAGKEYNLTSWDGETQITATNDSAINVSLFPMENPGMPTRDGYAFMGWEDQFGNLWTAEDIANGGRTGTYNERTIRLTAKWGANATATYKFNNGQEDQVINTYVGAVIQSMEVNNRAHYVFTGWYQDEACTQLWNFDDTITGDLTLYAGWSATAYTAELQTNGGLLVVDENVSMVETGKYTFAFVYSDTETYTLPTPTREHYDFAGWYATEDMLGTAITEVPVSSAGGLVYYAKWTLTATAYTITYELNGGTNATENPEAYTAGTAVVLSDATKAGHTFDGWYSDSALTQKITGISDNIYGDVTVYAKFVPASYTITYHNVEGANNGNPTEYTHGQLINLAGATKEGYTFDGWYTDSACTESIDKIAASMYGNLDIYAKFTEIPLEETIYTITYHNVEDATNPNTATQYIESNIVSFVDASKAGYVFYGWYLDSEYITKVVSTEGRTENLDLYAKWKAVISYELDGGTNASSNPVEYTEGTAVALANANKEGYTFEGWYLDAEFTTEVTEISATATGPITLYAKFVEIKQEPDDSSSDDSGNSSADDSTTDSSNDSSTSNSSNVSANVSGCGGCNGSIGGGAAALIIAISCSAVLFLRKKKQD